MNQKNIIQIAVIIVIAVWIGCGSYIISSNISEKSTTAPATTVATTTQATVSENPTGPLVATTMSPATTKSTTTAASTTLPSTTLNIGGNNVVTTVGQVEAPEWQQSQLAEQSKQDAQSSFQQVKDNIPKTTEEIISAYIKGVNNLKKAKNFTMNKDDKLNITVDDMTGGTLVKSFADQLIAGNQKKPVSYTFENGVDAATGKTPMDVIAPLGIKAQLNADSVKDARSAVTDTEGSYVIKISLIDEHQVYPDQAAAHSKMVEVVDVNSLLISGMTITSLDILYSGTYIEANIDKDGRITSMKHFLPVTEAKGTGKYALINAEMALHGDFTSVYTFTY